MVNLIVATVEASTEGISPEMVGVIIASVIAALGGGVAVGRKTATTVTNDPLNVKSVADYMTRKEHDQDMREIRSLIRNSETRAHERMDETNTKLDQLIGMVTALHNNHSSN